VAAKTRFESKYERAKQAAAVAGHLSNRSVKGCAQHTRHDCCGRHVGIAASLRADGKALAVNAANIGRAAPLILSLQVKTITSLTSGPAGPPMAPSIRQGSDNGHRHNSVFSLRRSAGRWHR
jgi:hypothetical protein